MRIVNTSKNGLRLRSAAGFPVGAMVQVRRKGFVVIGEVRYCSEVEDGGFYVRIEILTSFPLGRGDVAKR